MSRAFSGSNQRLTVNDNAALRPAGSWSFAFWFKYSNTVSEQTLINKGNQATGRQTYWISVYDPSGTNNKITIVWTNTSGTEFLLQGTTAISTSVWTHVAATWDGTTCNIYLNGSLEATATTAIIPDTTITDEMLVGAAKASTGTFNLWLTGDLTELSMWSVALSAADVTSLYNGAHVTAFGVSKLIAYWPILGHHAPEIELIRKLELGVTNATKSTSRPRAPIRSGQIQISNKGANSPYANPDPFFIPRLAGTSRTSFQIKGSNLSAGMEFISNALGQGSWYKKDKFSIYRDNNAAYTTTSTSFAVVDNTNLTYTMVLGANTSGNVLLGFTGAAQFSTGGGAFSFTYNGTNVSTSVDGLFFGNQTGVTVPIGMTCLVTGLSSGTYIWRLVWKSMSGNQAVLLSGAGAGADPFVHFYGAEL